MIIIMASRARKNLQNSEFSGGRLFDKIEWGPPLKTEKLLWVMKKTEKARIEWGGSHSILATGARRNPELRGGSHSILSKRQPLRGGSQFPFYPVKKGRLPIPILSCQKGGPCGAATILSWQKDKTRNILKKSDFLSHSILVKKGGPLGAAPILSWLQAESRICGFCLFARIEWRLPLTLRFWTHSILHTRYQEKWIFPSYKAKLNLTLFAFENLITDA